jgi:hypothetical protein
MLAVFFMLVAPSRALGHRSQLGHGLAVVSLGTFALFKQNPDLFITHGITLLRLSHRYAVANPRRQSDVGCRSPTVSTVCRRHSRGILPVMFSRIPKRPRLLRPVVVACMA